VAVADLAAAARIGAFSHVFTPRSAVKRLSCEHVLSEADEPRPTTAYGRSKLRRDALRASAFLTRYFAGARVRPNAPGNMGALVRLAASPWRCHSAP